MKLKHILPFASIASIATVAIPMATSCSCSSGINLDENIKIGEVQCLSSKDPIDFVKGQSYTFNIDIGKYDWTKVKFDIDKFGTFAFYDFDAETPVVLKYSVEGYSVDGVNLTKDSPKTFEEMKNDTYCYSGDNFLVFMHKGLTKQSTATLKIKVDDNKKACPIFLPAGGI